MIAFFSFDLHFLKYFITFRNGIYVSLMIFCAFCCRVSLDVDSPNLLQQASISLFWKIYDRLYRIPCVNCLFFVPLAHLSILMSTRQSCHFTHASYAYGIAYFQFTVIYLFRRHAWNVYALYAYCFCICIYNGIGCSMKHSTHSYIHNSQSVRHSKKELLLLPPPFLLCSHAKIVFVCFINVFETFFRLFD